MDCLPIRQIILFFIFVLLGRGASAGTVTLYVSPTGSDNADGRTASAAESSGPFRTLERARDEIRAIKRSGKLPNAFVVELQPGTYELSRPLELTSDDSGSPNCPITYCARNPGEAHLTGGKVLTGFVPVTDPQLLERLNPTARGHVVQIDLKALGVSDLGSLGGGWGRPSTNDRLELFYDDKPMPLARWPNSGFLHIAAVTDEQLVNVRGTKGSRAPQFYYDEKELGDRPKRWAKEQDLWLHGSWFWDWADGRQRLQSVDTTTRLIRLAPPVHPYGYRKGQWWYAYNALCEIDRPGEWFLDRPNGMLYFWPPSPIGMGRAVVSILPSLISLNNCRNVQLRGLTLECTRGISLLLHNSVGNSVVACTIRNCGGYAVSLPDGSDNRILGCDMYNMGDGGVILGGGDRATLTPGDNIVDNCHIHHFGRWNSTGRAGIDIRGVGQQVTHNLIDNAPNSAVLFEGNDHVIEYNEIHSVVREAMDAGAIYAGRDWSMVGTVVRYNYLHDISGFAGRGCVGVYLDDQLGGTQVCSNVFYKVDRAILIGGGRSCLIENNIFVGCTPALYVDARGLGLGLGKDGLVASLSAVPYRSSPWKEKYPWLLTLLEDEPMAPKYNLIARNVCVHGRWSEFEAKAVSRLTLANNLIDQDPQFVGAAQIQGGAPRATDFALGPSSPAFKMGFERQPLEKIGVHQDSDRATWPVTSVVRPTNMAAE